MALKVVKPRVRKVSSEAQTLKETQRMHEEVVLNEWLSIGKCWTHKISL